MDADLGGTRPKVIAGDWSFDGDAMRRRRECSGFMVCGYERLVSYGLVWDEGKR